MNDSHASETSRPDDPRDADPGASEAVDPHSGRSDDPRVDPTPDRRQSDTSGTGPPQ